MGAVVVGPEQHEAVPGLGQVNLYPWKHVPLDLRTGKLWVLYDGLDQASEQFTQNDSQKAPKGLYTPRVHVHIFEDRQHVAAHAGAVAAALVDAQEAAVLARPALAQQQNNR